MTTSFTVHFFDVDYFLYSKLKKLYDQITISTSIWGTPWAIRGDRGVILKIGKEDSIIRGTLQNLWDKFYLKLGNIQSLTNKKRPNLMKILI